MGVMVVVSYRPKEGKEAALRALLREHVPLLRDEGLATERDPLVMKSSDGIYLEIFEWVSDESIADAHENLVVTELWQRFGIVCEYANLAELSEASKPFAHFEPVEL